MSAYPKVSKVLRYVDALRGVVIVGFKAHTKKLPHCGGLKRKKTFRWEWIIYTQENNMKTVNESKSSKLTGASSAWVKII